MPIDINDSFNPANEDDSLNIIQAINALAYQVRQLSGKNSWKESPDKSISELITVVQNNSNLFFKANGVTLSLDATDQVLASFTIPAGKLSINSIVRITFNVSTPGSATNRVLKLNCNGVLLYNQTIGANGLHMIQKHLSFGSSLSTPYFPPNIANSYAAVTSAFPIRNFADFSLNQTFNLVGTMSSGTGQMLLEFLDVEIL